MMLDALYRMTPRNNGSEEKHELYMNQIHMTEFKVTNKTIITTQNNDSET